MVNNGNNTILKFTPGGVGSVFANTGSYTSSLAFDSAGNVYVTHFLNNTIQEFSSTGTDLGVFASTGLNAPVAIAILSYSAQVQQPINLDGSSVFGVKRGVVPVKFTLTLNGVATCNLPPAVNRNA